MKKCVFIFLVCSIFLACSDDYGDVSAYAFLSAEYTPLLSRIMEEDNYSGRFIIIRDLLKKILADEGIDSLRSFVHQYSIQNPDDSFTGYYMLLVAGHYRDRNTEMSNFYYEQVLNLHEDTIVEDQSIHYLALHNLLFQVTDPARRIRYYRHLLNSFSGRINPGRTWYRLAQEYRGNGQFDDYFTALEEFQNYPDTTVPGKPDIHQEIARELDFHYNSRKDWTHPSLTTLVENIKNALTRKQPTVLERYRAKETFFAMSWLQDVTDFNSQLRFDIGLFLIRTPRITSDADFTIVNETEAFLKTSGWSYRIPNWYFYFRKVDYPADPEIHGNWEWAGIFFGDTL
ncbi:MAG: hypothetical protein ACR2PY_01760 [Salinispira sp.]